MVMYGGQVGKLVWTAMVECTTLTTTLVPRRGRDLHHQLVMSQWMKNIADSLTAGFTFTFTSIDTVPPTGQRLTNNAAATGS